MTELRLIPDIRMGKTLEDPSVGEVSGEDVIDFRTRIRRSVLWAAYGDALGWISELTNESGLKRRTQGAPLRRPIKWTRRIGGRFGVTASLPAGCYSDDSQLRLATSRAISSKGFDVEAFSKVELPVWLSYALGGGKSTSAAAANFAKPKVKWFANTYKGWENSGGNGAAMRIQPHVWAARDAADITTFLPDVVRNSVCTHSHPNGILGAVIHALTLAHTIHMGRPPSPDELITAIDVAEEIPNMIQDDFEIASYWQPTFERESGEFNEAWGKAITESREVIRAAGDAAIMSGIDGYTDMIDQLKLRDPARRGSGALTAIAAIGLIWCEPRPEESLSVAANAIGTDTDTIATMAGAILGLMADAEPPIEVLDEHLFRSEADRLWTIANGGKSDGHRYPDLLNWSAPRTRSDALLRESEEKLLVHGLGYAQAMEDPIDSSKDDFKWQWIKLEIGQTLLIKRRRNLLLKSEVTLGMPTSQYSVSPPHDNSETLNFNLSNADKVGANTEHTSGITAEDWLSQSDLISEFEDFVGYLKMVDYLREHRDDDRRVGSAIRRVINKGTDGQISAFLAAVVDCLREPRHS